MAPSDQTHHQPSTQPTSSPPSEPKITDSSSNRSFAAVLQNSTTEDPTRTLKKSLLNEDPNSAFGLVSKYKGKPGIIFSEEEINFLAQPLKFALVGKFSHGLPSLKFLRQKFESLGLKGSFTIGAINFKHILINLTHEEDFTRFWLRGEWTFAGYNARLQMGS